MEKYNPAAYRIYLQLSDKKHVLVEGKSERIAFKQLKYDLGIDELEIDSAEYLIEFEDSEGHLLRLGNRDKVEEISRSVVAESRNLETDGKEPYADKFIGFVDREYREFQLSNSIQDLLNCHRVSDRLVWSRGHSIENYLFDFDIFFEPLRIFSAEHFNMCRILFARVWNSAVYIACAASLIGYEINKPNLVDRSLEWDILNIDPPEVSVDLVRWKQNLCDKHNLNAIDTEELVRKFTHWHEIAKSTDLYVIRWLSHGHIGFHFFWKVYTRCVFEVCQDVKIAEKILVDENNRFNACVVSWSKGAINYQYEYPADVFRLLDFPLPGP